MNSVSYVTNAILEGRSLRSFDLKKIMEDNEKVLKSLKIIHEPYGDALEVKASDGRVTKWTVDKNDPKYKTVKQLYNAVNHSLPSWGDGMGYIYDFLDNIAIKYFDSKERVKNVAPENDPTVEPEETPVVTEPQSPVVDSAVLDKAVDILKSNEDAAADGYDDTWGTGDIDSWCKVTVEDGLIYLDGFCENCVSDVDEDGPWYNDLDEDDPDYEDGWYQDGDEDLSHCYSYTTSPALCVLDNSQPKLDELGLWKFNSRRPDACHYIPEDLNPYKDGSLDVKNHDVVIKIG